MSENRVVLVTGGASGIGRAIVEAFAAQSASLVIADINQEEGQEYADSLTQRGLDALFCHIDVSQASEVKAMIEQVKERYGRLDCAINNAGIEGAPVRTADVTEADFDQIMAVNVKGVWLCMKHQIPLMLEQGGGCIVNMASVAGLVGAHSMPAYAASKHAVVGLTKTAAVEYIRKGIRVNAVCPAVVRTPMVERACEVFPQMKDKLEGNNPARRLGEPEEVAAAVVWLCSEGASFVNGATLTVDGGLVAQ